MRDAQDIFAYSRDPLVAKHVLWSTHRTLQDARNYLHFILRQYRDGDPSSFGIQLKETGRIIGTIGFMSWSREDSSAEVGYSMAREHWGKGLMTEALAAVLEFAFSSIGLHRVWAVHEADNPASGRVMEKCGMRYEGLMRGAVWNKGRYADVVQYGILKEDKRPR